FRRVLFRSPGTAGTAGLWLSTDGGTTFVPMTQDTVNDVDLARLPGGVGRVDAATADGLQRSIDQGGHFTRIRAHAAFSAVRHEWSHPNVLMAVVDGIPMRSLDNG